MHHSYLPPGEPDTIPALVARNAGDRPDSPALIQGTRVVTWGDLAARAAATARWLRQHGVSPGDRVTLQCGESLTLDDMVAVVGIVSVCGCHPIMTNQPLAARRRLIERVAPVFVFASTEIDDAGYSAPVVRHLGGLPLDAGTEPGSGPDPATVRSPAASDVALIVGTSGTTAEPKLVPVTHQTLAAAGRMCSRMVGLNAGDRLLMLATPGVGLFCVSFVPFWTGGAVVIPEDQAGHPRAAGQAGIEPTWAAGAPGRLAQVARTMPPSASSETSFRFVLSAGAPATEETAEAISQGFGAPRTNLYGASESFSMAYDGRPGAPLRIAALAGDGVVEASAGEPGEVQASGDMVFPGYLDDPALTAAAFTSDGWYRTGDLGRINPDGRLELLGRLSEIINRGGLKIAPSEIEAALLGCPGVAEAIAFAVPDPALGEVPALAVTPIEGSGLTARQVRRHLLGRLQADKTPTLVFLLDRMPVTDAGKISRRELAALLAPSPLPLDAP